MSENETDILPEDNQPTSTTESTDVEGYEDPAAQEIARVSDPPNPGDGLAAVSDPPNPGEGNA